MRRFLFLTLALLFAGTTAMTQPGVIGVYGDPNGGSCDIYDYPGADVLVYAIHTYSPGSTGSRFKLRWTGGASMSYLGEVVSAPYSAKGTAFNGISIEYGTCAVSPNILITLHFSGNGSSPNCSFLVVLPHPGDESVYITDCSDPPNQLVAGNECLVINSDLNCLCDIPGSSPCPDIVPVQQSTWGHIKMLYLRLD